jgi:hypothetical protein
MGDGSAVGGIFGEVLRVWCERLLQCLVILLKQRDSSTCRVS